MHSVSGEMMRSVSLAVMPTTERRRRYTILAEMPAPPVPLL